MLPKRGLGYYGRCGLALHERRKKAPENLRIKGALLKPSMASVSFSFMKDGSAEIKGVPGGKGNGGAGNRGVELGDEMFNYEYSRHKKKNIGEREEEKEFLSPSGSGPYDLGGNYEGIPNKGKPHRRAEGSRGHEEDHASLRGKEDLQLKSTERSNDVFLRKGEKECRREMSFYTKRTFHCFCFKKGKRRICLKFSQKLNNNNEGGGGEGHKKREPYIPTKGEKRGPGTHDGTKVDCFQGFTC